MSFRTLPFIGISLLVLTACMGPAEVSYRLTFDTVDPAEVEALTRAAIRVIERRLDRLESTLTEQAISKDADGVTIALAVDNADIVDTLTAELTSPFELTFMIATDDTEPDVTIEGQGGFNDIGIGGESLESVTAQEDLENDQGRILLTFTDAGQTAMAQVFKDNVGKGLGLFVRGHLVSILTIQSADLQKILVIDGIPDLELANVFADDVNVGLHVTITPQ